MPTPRGAAGAEIARGLTRTSMFLLAALAGPASVRGQGAPYETVVEAPRRDDAAPAEDAAASSSVVTDDRTPRAAESLPQILAELPGAHVTRLGGMGSLATVSLRGSTPEQVLIYVDGIPLNVAWGGGVDLSTVPLGDVERVEVYRGMTPVAFGESALGGVVSVTTREPVRTGAAVEAGMGSFGTRFGGASASWAGRRLRLYTGAHVTWSDGDFPYRDDMGSTAKPEDDVDRTRVNNQYGQLDGILRAVAPLGGRRELTASLLGFSRRQGLPGEGSDQTMLASLVTRRALASLAYESRDDLGPGGRLRALAWGSLLEQRLADPFGEVAAVPAETVDRTRSAGASVTGARPVATWLRVAATLDGRGEILEPSDQGADGVAATRSLGATAVEADAWIAAARLDVIPSARLEAARDVPSGRDGFYRMLPAADPAVHVLPLARLGLLQRPRDDLAIRANVGRYARLPSFFELYADTGTALGSPDLRPESGVNADLGVVVDRRGEGGRLRAEATGFGARTDGLIAFQINARDVARAVNVDRARTLGAETTLLLETPRRFRLVAQGTFTDARDDGDTPAYRGKQLPLRPRWRAYLRPEVRRLRLPAGLVAGAFADADWTAGNYVNRTNLPMLPSRLLVGAGASIGRADGSARVVLSALNLLDARVIDLTQYPLPGRSAFVSLVVSTPVPTPAQESP